MLDPAITEFFDNREAAWLKKNIKASMEEFEVNELHLATTQSSFHWMSGCQMLQKGQVRYQWRPIPVRLATPALAKIKMAMFHLSWRKPNHLWMVICEQVM